MPPRLLKASFKFPSPSILILPDKPFRKSEEIDEKIDLIAKDHFKVAAAHQIQSLSRCGNVLKKLGHPSPLPIPFWSYDTKTLNGINIKKIWREEGSRPKNREEAKKYFTPDQIILKP